MTNHQPDAFRGNLLAVDDEAEILNSLKRQFRKKYNVYTAENAADGYQVMKETPIHVVISDQRMPKITGTEFFGRIKNEFPDAVRLILTGYSDIEAIIDAINSGNVFRYIIKPWDPGELDSIVAQAFERYRLIMENRNLLQGLRRANETLEARVTERTAELEAANKKLVSLNEQKDKLLGVAAHDLRTPLSGIIGLVRMLLEYDDLDGKEREKYLEMIHTVSANMLDMVSKMLDVAKIKQGKLELSPREVELKTFLAEVVKLNRSIGASKGIFLDCRIDPEAARAHFDPERIEQVLNNLIANAFKFSHPDTSVTIAVTEKNGTLEFSVSDQGLGIREDELPTIFGEFQRTSTRSTDGAQGAGLGLAICKKIVEEHGGRIGAESRPGEGSCFYFTLP